MPLSTTRAEAEGMGEVSRGVIRPAMLRLRFLRSTSTKKLGLERLLNHPQVCAFRSMPAPTIRAKQFNQEDRD